MSHILHFYHLAALDYVNPTVLVGGVPTPLKRPFLCPRYDDNYYINNARVNAMAGLMSAIPGNPYGTALTVLTTLPGDGGAGNHAGAINAYLVGQYLKALDVRRICHEMQAIFSGRAPQCSGWTAGGATATVDRASVNKYKELLYWGASHTGTPNNPAAGTVMAFIGKPDDFVQGRAFTYMFDVVAAAHLFPEYFWIGNSWGNFMANGWGESGFLNGVSDFTNHVLNGLALVNLAPNNPDARGLSRGWRTGGAAFPYSGVPGNLNFIPPNTLNITRIGESIAGSRYNPYPGGGLPNANFRHPWNGVTNPNPAAPGGYSWLKSPRYDTVGNGADLSYKPFEVGPLARQVVQGNYYGGLLNALGYVVTPTWLANGPDIKNGDGGLGTALKPVYSLLTGGNNGPNLSAVQYNGDSTLDRIAARAVETLLMGLMAAQWINDLDGTIGGDGYGPSGCTDRGGENVPNRPTTYRGYGMSEASRGALSHWIALKNGKTTLYQAVVPTTWNASPRDANGNPGPSEKSLESDGGLWIADPTQPIEIIRSTHSYDFCIACAVHLITPKGDVVKVDVPALPG
jgi:Ni,Fe-hydrogenase I large subunit